MPEEKEPTLGVISQFGKTYGPYAFGLLSLLLIWFSIVKPELQQSQVRLDEQHELIKQLQVLSRSLEDVSRNLQDVSRRWERLEPKP